MRVGIHLGTTTTSQKLTGDGLARLAEEADRAGFATLVVADHFSLRPAFTPYLREMGQADAPVVTEFLEAWSTLAYLAAHTNRIRLSTLVSGITMRFPAVLVKTVDTLDMLSNGRAYLGVGASPDFGADEHQRLGLPFPPAGSGWHGWKRYSR